MYLSVALVSESSVERTDNLSTAIRPELWRWTNSMARNNVNKVSFVHGCGCCSCLKMASSRTAST